jgi:hypothetical protein
MDLAAGDLRLLAGSAAIDVIDPAAGLPVADLRGVWRPQGAGHDLGAFEYGVGPEPDLNGDGRVDIGDYFLIDRGAAMGLSGLRNGDANWDGVIDADDYAVVDRAFLAQHGGGAGPGSILAPEPVALALIGLSCGLLRRRKD